MIIIRNNKILIFSALHDTILATQLRHINRELTPTISEVYHERNIGLGLAPPLAKLLLNQSNQTAPKPDSTVLEKITLGNYRIKFKIIFITNHNYYLKSIE